jgi:hypothetical protein
MRGFEPSESGQSSDAYGNQLRMPRWVILPKPIRGFISYFDDVTDNISHPFDLECIGVAPFKLKCARFYNVLMHSLC